MIEEIAQILAHDRWRTDPKSVKSILLYDVSRKLSTPVRSLSAKQTSHPILFDAPPCKGKWWRDDPSTRVRLLGLTRTTLWVPEYPYS